MIVLYLEQDSFSFSLHSTVGFELVTQLKGAFWVCMHTPSCYDKATIKNCNIFNEYIFVVSPQKLPDWIILPFCFNWMHTADSPKGYWGLSCFMYGTFYKVANIFTWTNNRELSKTKKNHTKKNNQENHYPTLLNMEKPTERRSTLHLIWFPAPFPLHF